MTEQTQLDALATEMTELSDEQIRTRYNRLIEMMRSTDEPLAESYHQRKTALKTVAQDRGIGITA